MNCKIPARTVTFDKVLADLQPSKRAEFVRNGDPGFNNLSPSWNQTWGHDGFTRDQMMPIVAAMDVWGNHRDLLLDLWKALPLDRLGKHSFNGDWVSVTDICDALPPAKPGEEGSGLTAEKCKAVFAWHPKITPAPLSTDMPKLPAQNCSAIQKINCDPLPSCANLPGHTDCNIPFSPTSCPVIDDRCPNTIKEPECPLTTVDVPGPPVPGLCPSNQKITIKGKGPFVQISVAGPRLSVRTPGVCHWRPCWKTTSKAGLTIKIWVPGPPVDKQVDAPPEACMRPGPAVKTKICNSTACLVCVANNQGIDRENAANQAQCSATEAFSKGICTARQLAQASHCSPMAAVSIPNQLLCETAKFSLEGTCKATKLLADSECTLRNVFSGDVIEPQDVNLFRNALGGDPSILSGDLPIIQEIPPEEVGTQALGISVLNRIKAAQDRDNTGDDLNLIVALLTTDGVIPTNGLDARTYYAENRPYSYGSYFGEYFAHYCDEIIKMNDDDSKKAVVRRIEDGIRSGWKPDLSAVAGAVVWYHSPQTGANPELAKLYEPIISHFFPDPRPLQKAPPAKCAKGA